MSQEQRQQATHDEKPVPSTDRVKLSATNIRIEPTMPQKEETFQVVLEIIKASLCFKVFTITNDVPEIYIQQIIDNCLKVLNEDFVAPPSEEELLTFLIELGYKRPMDHLARMFVHHMHQLWRTLATIINKFLSGKTSSNDRLCQSRVAIFQSRLRSRKIMPYPRFTKIIINHFLLLNPSVPKGPSFALHTIKNDGVISRLKFVRIGADTMQVIKNNKKPSRSQPYNGGSSEGAGITPEVPNEPTFIFTTLSEGTGTKPRVPNKVKGTSKAKVDYAIDGEKEKQVNHDDDDNRSIDIEETDDDDKNDDEFVHGDEYVHDDVDMELKDAKDNETGKDNE
uniref:Uncharacterized protein n=1 Tax=Tanacetum cinerariifolium TaxID=118510 RepID=A0A699H083_TANCI|nr:hypothetical protein [Tanacetum cinerariifolium]